MPSSPATTTPPDETTVTTTPNETTVVTMLPDGRLIKTTERRHPDGSKTVERETIGEDGGENTVQSSFADVDRATAPNTAALGESSRRFAAAASTTRDPPPPTGGSTPRLEVEAPREPPAPLQFDSSGSTAGTSMDEQKKKAAASSAKGASPSVPGAFRAGGNATDDDERQTKRVASSAKGAKGTTPSVPGAFRAGGAAQPEVIAPQEPQSAYERKTAAFQSGGTATGSGAAAAARTAYERKGTDDSLQRKIEQGQRNHNRRIAAAAAAAAAAASRTTTATAEPHDDSWQRKIAQGQRDRQQKMAASATAATAARTSEPRVDDSLQRKIDQGQRNRVRILASLRRNERRRNDDAAPEQGQRVSDYLAVGEVADNRAIETQMDATVASSRAVRVHAGERMDDLEERNGASLDAGAEENKATVGGRKKIKLYVGLALALVVVIVAVVVPVVLLTKDDDDSDDDGNDAGSEVPTEPDNSVYNALLNISLEEDLTSETTPQYQALDWILHKDTLGLSDASPNLFQRYSLMVLFFATDGANWKMNEEQFGNVLQHECNWTLVECSLDISNIFGASRRRALSTDKVVTGLNLQDMRLKGRLPREFRELTYLENLNLSQNSLSGSFPPELYELRNLRAVDLDQNNFDSSIDERIGDLTRLQELSVSSNAFSGVLPTAFQNLTDMRKLVLMDNSFSGPLFDNILPMLHIDTLWVSNTYFGGTIPTGIGKLSKLRYLECQGTTSIEGNIPDEFGQLESLVDCVLSGNQLRGNIPPTLGNLSSLKNLWLDVNDLSGTIISEFGRLTNLESLRLDSNELTGAIPTEVCALRSGNLSSLRVDCDIVHGGCCSECRTVSPPVTIIDCAR